MSQTSNVLIIQTAFLGDAVLITSLLEKIRQESPQTKVQLLVRAGLEPIFEAYPHDVLTKVWGYDKSNKLRSWLNLRKQLSNENFDQVLLVQRFSGMGLLSISIGAKKVVGFQQNPFSFFFSQRMTHRFGQGVHEIERNTDLVQKWLGDKVFRPFLLATPRLPDGLVAQKYLCISPGSVWETKRLPLQTWIDLIHELPKEQAIVLMGAPNETDLAAQIVAACSGRNIHNLTGKLGLLEAIGVYQESQMAFVNDSGPMHICSAVNTPTVAVFCSTTPAFGFGPLATWNRIIESTEALACKPCGSHGKKSCPLGHYACGNGIQVKQLRESYDACLSARSE
jgi:heptosyltransferase-2